MSSSFHSDQSYVSRDNELRVRNFWKDHGVYALSVNGPRISVDTPPPTVSGNLHIGHVFSYTHTDILVRYKRLTGAAVYYPMGFDDNGLPTERYVEKQNKLSALSLPRHEFRALCQREVATAHTAFTTLWQRLGLSVDWSTTYSTISPRVQRLSQQAFLRLYKKGKLTRTAQPALLCPTCRTTVAQAELESLEKQTVFYTIPFTIAETKAQVTIATTRPELLPACVAVFCHPTDERYQSLIGTTLLTPYFNTSVTVRADEKVDPTKGTGLVMCCTFGDQTDIYWQQTHHLTPLSILDQTGFYNKASGPLEGIKAGEAARKKMVELLTEHNLIISQEAHTHSTQIHERCKQPIEYTILPQWSVCIMKDKELFLAAAEKIEWVPSYMKSRYDDWVRNLKWDWCISRQRSYGIPLPVWHCLDCGTPVCAEEVALPVDPTIHTPTTPCSNCGSRNTRPDTDVLDTWFTSSLSPYINQLLESENPLDTGAQTLTLPFSIRPQAHDIIRTWAFYTIVQAQYHSGTIPWNTITISGHVTAGNGKISKSQGGAQITPEYLLETYSADAIRYWAAKGKLGVDTAFSEEQIKIGARLVTKLWNAFKFIEMNCSAEMRNTRATEVLSGTASHFGSNTTGIHRWIWAHYTAMFERYTHAFARYDYAQALEEIDRFFWNDFCDTYIEVVKDILMRPERYDEHTHQETLASLCELGIRILQCYAPVVPHITETLYQRLYRAEGAPALSLTTQAFVEETPVSLSAADAATVRAVLHVIATVRKEKSLAQCSLKTPVRHLRLWSTDAHLGAALGHYKTLLSGILHAQHIEIHDGTTEIRTTKHTEPESLSIDVQMHG